MVQDFKTMQEMVNRLKATNSNVEKTNILKEYSNNEFIKQAFLYTFSPYKQYGIRTKTALGLSKKLEPTHDYNNIFTLLDALDNKVITGHKAVKAFLGFIKDNVEYENLICSIIDNNLQTRTSATTINKIFDNVVPKFNVALAASYLPQMCDFEKETWYASRKLDGVRCLIFTGSNNNPIALSRSGKPFETLQKVLDDIKSLNMPNHVFDGELCLINPDGSDNFNEVMSEIRRKNHTIENPRFKIFDLITQSDFDNQSSTTTLSERLTTLENIQAINTLNNIEVLEQEIVTNDDDFAKWANDVKEFNWEGFMLRKDTTYEGKRSKNLLKVKTMHDDEYIVTSITSGPIRHIVYDKNPDGSTTSREVVDTMISNLVIEHKGSKVGVGSGLNIKQRIAWHNDPDLIIGKQICVQYFEECQDKLGNYSLRFPVLKHVYEGTRDV
jgi:DNA ligase-1